MSRSPAGGPDYGALLRELAAGPGPETEPDPTDARILDATLRLASEYGEQRLTIDQVARQSRVARATIFRRFGSKDALIARMHEQVQLLQDLCAGAVEMTQAEETVSPATDDVAHARATGEGRDG